MDENKINCKCKRHENSVACWIIENIFLFLADVFVVIDKFNHRHYFAISKLTRASFQSWQNLPNCKLCLIARSIFIIFRKLLCSSSAVNAFAAGRTALQPSCRNCKLGRNDFREMFSVLSQRICSNEWGLKLCRYAQM